MPSNPSPRHPHARRGRTAFTLLELLIVITAIAVIAGTLGAASSKASLRARTVGCQAHLRQWGAATYIHTLDNQDELPFDGAPNGISTRDAWYVDLPRALGMRPYPEEGGWRTNATAALPKSIWLCPANPRRSNGRMLFHYALNRRVNGSGPGPRQTRLSEIPEPSALIWMFENGKLAAVAAEGNVHTNAHGAGAHFLFLDGHVRRQAVLDYWDPVRKRPITNAPGLRWSP